MKSGGSQMIPTHGLQPSTILLTADLPQDDLAALRASRPLTDLFPELADRLCPGGGPVTFTIDGYTFTIELHDHAKDA